MTSLDEKQTDLDSREAGAERMNTSDDSDESRSGKPSDRAVFWLIFTFAFAVRAAMLLELSDSPFFAQLLGDSQSYDQWAKELRSEGWLWKEGLVYYQAPLYPYFLALVYAVVGRSIFAVLVFQSTLGALAAALLAGTARRFFGRAAGIGAGIISALYAPALYFDALVQKASLAYFCVALLFFIIALYLERPRARTALTSGIALGLLCLLRENSLFFIPVLCVWLVVQSGTEARRLLAPAACLLGLMLVLLPVGVRNYAVGGEFHITTSQFGPNFYIGNSSHANGFYIPLVDGHGSWIYERSDATALAEEGTGRKLTPAEVSSYWVDKTFNEMRSDPGRWLQLTGYKVLLLINQREVEDSDSIYAYADDSSVLRVLIPLLNFASIFSLAIIGTTLAYTIVRRHWIVYFYLAGFGATVVIFVMMDRYRHPIAPALILLAGLGAARTVELFRRSRSGARTRSLTRAFAVGVTALLASHISLNIPVHIAKGNAYYNLAVQTARYDREAAVRLFERSVQLHPRNHIALTELARGYIQQGNTQKARRALRAALELAPDFAAAKSLIDAVQ